MSPIPAAIVHRMARQRRWRIHVMKNTPKGKRMAIRAAWATAPTGRSIIRHATAASANTTMLMFPRLRSNSTGSVAHPTPNVSNRACRDTGSSAQPAISSPILNAIQATVASNVERIVSGTSAMASWGGYRYSPSYSSWRYRSAVSARYSGAASAIRRAAASYATKSYPNPRELMNRTAATIRSARPSSAATSGITAIEPGLCRSIRADDTARRR